jgi:hypothetical protein
MPGFDLINVSAHCCRSILDFDVLCSHFRLMKIDFKRLRREVERRKSARSTSSRGRIKTGATAVIREHLPDLERMHADGAIWDDIAAGLSAQGVRQGNGEPLTGRRLTALIHNIKTRDAKLASGVANVSSSETARIEPRHHPTTAAISQAKQSPGRSALTLATEMTDRKTARVQTNPDLDEQTLRRAEFAKHAHLLKKR